MLHIEINYYSSSTICKKSQVDIFKMTPTRRSHYNIINCSRINFANGADVSTFICNVSFETLN